ncbi:MAG: PqqD family peptide modification chaperone [Nitrospiraceae bacterium]|nr:PqqD family peptide modification chaperone [Nitrospiraceae bacterium]
MDNTLDSIPVRSDQVVFRKIENEYILVPLLSTSADVESIYNLNEIGAVIWEQIDGKKSLRRIIEGLVAEYEVEQTDAERDVLDFIRELVDSQLIRVS